MSKEIRPQTEDVDITKGRTMSPLSKPVSQPATQTQGTQTATGNSNSSGGSSNSQGGN